MKRSTSDRRIAGSELTANNMTSNNGMESGALEIRLRRRAIEIWVHCHDMDRRLKNHQAIKVCENLDQFRIPTREIP